MEGRMRPEGMTEEQFGEAKRVLEVTEQATADELWRLCCLMAVKQDGEMLGQTEFQMRDVIHRIAAITLEAAVNERRKKGVTTAAALPAQAVSTTRVLSTGGRKRS